jgi:hypothetical protein
VITSKAKKPKIHDAMSAGGAPITATVDTVERMTLEERFACPSCAPEAGSLVATSDAATCPACGTRYPMIACGETMIPWLVPRPDEARREWSARYRAFLLTITSEHNRLNRALADERLGATGRGRIAGALAAKRAQRQQAMELLAPVGLDCEDFVPAMTSVLQCTVPRNQHLSSYADNVFRDWAWDNGENDALLAAVEAVLSADSRDNLGAVLCLGAGASRLPYDVHRRFSPRLSVALDLNPLLLLVACRVIQGQHVSLHEFPTAPLDENACAVLQQCRAPAPLRTGADGEFRFVLGDATRPPFKRGSFDTVFTPWLIDIIHEDLRVFIPEINRLLPRGGVWINSGSLAFLHDDPRRCYSEAEVLERVEACGFEILAVDHREVPYLCSPHSANGRIERIVSFAAKKQDEAEVVRAGSSLPEWILDTSQAVPSSAESVLLSSSHLLLAQVWAAIDGKRSIEAISRLVAREYGLSLDECVHALQRILTDAWERGGRLDTL